MPSPAGGILVLTPLIFSLSGIQILQINYTIVVPLFFIATSLLLISKLPTYSFKKIVIRRSTTIFLLFSIVLFFGLLLIYTFELIAVSSLIYILLIPLSFFHFHKIKKESITTEDEDEKLEDIL